MNGSRRPSHPSLLLVSLLLAAALALAACAPSPTPSLPPSPTPSPTPSLPPTPSPTPTPAPPPALTADRLAAALPGLQALGAPAVRCPGGDDPALAALCLAVAHGAAPSLTFPQLTLEALPPDAAGGAAHGPALRRGAALTLLGRVQGGEQDGSLAFAVADAARGEGWLFFGLLAPGEAEALLEANGYGLARAGEAWRVVGGAWGEAGVALAAIPAEDPLLGRLQAAMGVWFFDKRVGPTGQLEFHPRPIVPHPPEELVPPGTPVTYQPDEKASTLTALGPDGQPLAQARFDEEKGEWVWEEALVLEPATLTLDEAKRFIAGAEYWTEEELAKRFEGRVFVDPKTGKKIILSKTVQNMLLSQISAEELAKMNQDEIFKELSRILGTSEWAEIWHRVIDKNYPLFGEVVFFSSFSDKAVVITLKPDPPEKIAKRRNISGLPLEEVTRGNVYSINSKTGYFVSPFEFPTNEFQFGVNWFDDGETVATHDGYRVRFILDQTPLGQSRWQKVPPGEHHYLITDPEKQVEFVVNKLRTEKSSHSAIYEFDRYLVTNPYDGLPQIIIPITDGVPGLTESQKQMILDYLFEKGRTKKSNEEKERQIYDMLKPLKNGFTPEQAKIIQNWFNAWFDKLSSNRGDKATEEVIKIITAADVRFVVSNGLDMMKRFTAEGYPYASIPNDFYKSIFGIEIDPYLDENTRDFLIHEIAQIYLLQVVGSNFTSEQRNKIEKILSASAPPLRFP